MVSEGIASKLGQDYSTIKDQNIIAAGIKKGRADYVRTLSNLCLSTENTSKVHSYDDVESQAFIIAIPSDNNIDEIALKTFGTYGAHFMDDHFDRPDLDPSPEKMAEHRHNIVDLLSTMGNVGKFGHIMAKKTPHPEAVYQGIHRNAYGGLIPLAKDSETQDLYLEEHKKLALRNVSKKVRTDLEAIRPLAYWMTTKTLMEWINAAEPKLDFTLSELWSVAYAPALYLHDNHEEKKKGELNFFGKQEPTVREMVQMIDIAAKHIKDHENGRAAQRLDQLKFLRKAFDSVLIPEVSEAYDRFEKELKKAIH